jgi:glycosyltransferase involved in cell wall biosynthesis
VVVGRGPDPSQRREAARVPRLDLRTAPGAHGSDEPWEDVDDVGEWLLALARREPPDVVQLHGFVHAALPFPAPVVVVAQGCVAAWWQAVKGSSAPTRLVSYRLRARAGMAAADAVVAPTRSFLDTVEALHGRARRRLVLPPALGPTSCPPASARLDAVLAVGCPWDRASGLDALDAAAEGLRWPVWIAGRPQDPGCGVSGLWHAKGLGRLSHETVRARMARASVFCHPVRHDPLAIEPLEAAKTGCALVLSDLPELREVWGDAAAFVRPGDAVALRRTLLELTRSRALVQQLGAAARRQASRLDADRQAHAWLGLYRQLTARHPAERGLAAAV